MMNSLKKNFTRRLNLPVLQINHLLLWLGLCLCTIQAVKSNENRDIFYIPQGTKPIHFDGQWTPTEWDQSNYFTFGYEGAPEVELYGYWLKTSTVDTLYLAIHIDDITVLPDLDQLFLCFNSQSNGAKPYWLKLSRANNSALFIQSRASDWFYSEIKEVQHRIYSQANYWETEIKIPFTFLEDRHSPSGIYLQVFDFYYINKPDEQLISYIEYHWPILHSACVIYPDQVPSAGDWANFYLINSTFTTQPDIFFSNRMQVLYSNEQDGDVIVIPNHKNRILTKIDNHYLNGTSIIRRVSLKLQWSEFGVSNFNDITTDTNFSMQPNMTTDKLYNWFPPSYLSRIITLRAEVQRSVDAITCNNATRRDMMFFQLPVGRFANAIATISDIPISEVSTLQSKVDQTNSTEMLYFFIDRSGLDVDSLWQIDLCTLEGDTLENIGKDRFRLAYQRGESKKISLQIKVPDVFDQTPSSFSHMRNAFRKLFQSKQIKEKKNTVPLTSKSLSFTEDNSQLNKVEDHPILRRQRIRVQVSKEMNRFVVDKEVYHQFSVLGYFGIEVEIIAKELAEKYSSSKGNFFCDVNSLYSKKIYDPAILLILISILVALVYFIKRRRISNRDPRTSQPE